MRLQIANLRAEAQSDVSRLRHAAQAVTEALELDDFTRTRFSTAVVELARNAITHAGGGRVTFGLDEENGQPVLALLVSDQGKGIADVEAAMSGRWRSATGLGLGLRGVKRVADHFAIESGPGGTRVTARFALRGNDAPLGDLAKRASDALSRMRELDPADALAQQNRELLQALAERDMLMREMHHRTKNNLALIASLAGLARRGAVHEETKSALESLEARIHGVAGIHDQLHRGERSEGIGLVPYVTGLAERMGAALGAAERGIALSVTGEDLVVPGTLAIDIGLIIGELITNALKHAFPKGTGGSITVAVAHGPEELRVEVCDTGVGFPGGLEALETSRSLGWRMLKATVARHAGQLTIEEEGGLCVGFALPLPRMGAEDSAPA